MTEAELVDRIREGLMLGAAAPPPATDETGDVWMSPSFRGRIESLHNWGGYVLIY